jgi:hypothetical protein
MSLLFLTGGVEVVFQRFRWQMQWVFCTDTCYSLQLKAVPCRSECDPLLTSWFTNTCHAYRCESVWSMCYPRLVTNWICQVMSCRSYGIGWVLWYLQCYGVSLTLAASIKLTRQKHAASHHHSVTCHVLRIRKIHIFLIVIFLVVNVINGVFGVSNVNDAFFRGYT